MNPNQAKVLIVDDSKQTLLLLRTLMTNLGFASIEEAQDGRSALALIELNHYDLVLADWNMPFLSGIALVRIIRQMPEGKRPPVLLISGDVSAQRGVEALQAGVSGLVSKPFVNATLCEKVLRMLSSIPVSEFIASQRAELHGDRI